jgi:hypothetical protein
MLELRHTSGGRRNSNTMRTESFHADRLAELFQSCKIATMPQLKEALGTQVDLTVFRKLKELGYRTSYSHRSRYYTLNGIAQFGDSGLWSYRSVWFSRFGTLVNTGEAFVTGSEAGYFVEELDNVLHVETKAALLKLYRRGRVCREEVSGRYLYCSPDPGVQEHQVEVRRQLEFRPGTGRSIIDGEAVPEELRARVILYCSLLDEKQRRLYAGLESLKLGPGGDRRVGEFLGMDPHTVARGREQLLGGEFEPERIRKAGAGRPPLEKKRRK